MKDYQIKYLDENYDESIYTIGSEEIIGAIKEFYWVMSQKKVSPIPDIIQITLIMNKD